MYRKATINRKTLETEVYVSLSLDGSGKSELDIPLGFLSHMLALFAKHGSFDMKVTALGDINVDDHHLTEDIGIVLGRLFNQILGDKKGINRYGFFILPMDEVLATVAIDFCGRYAFRFDCQFTREKVGDLSTELVAHFWDVFAQNANVALHIKVESGRNDHHKIEAIFKATARAIRMAGGRDFAVNQIPSTKGTL